MQTTLWGNLILGPTARDMHLPEVAAETTEDILTYILGKCKQLVPHFDAAEVIHTFSGSRAKNSTGDWIIGVCPTSAQFINAAGIDSPGLAGSPAIALEIVRLLQSAGLKLKKNPNFNPIRAPIIVPKDGWKGIKAGPVGEFPALSYVFYEWIYIAASHICVNGVEASNIYCSFCFFFPLKFLNVCIVVYIVH